MSAGIILHILAKPLTHLHSLNYNVYSNQDRYPSNVYTLGLQLDPPLTR